MGVDPIDARQLHYSRPDSGQSPSPLPSNHLMTTRRAARLRHAIEVRRRDAGRKRGARVAALRPPTAALALVRSVHARHLLALPHRDLCHHSHLHFPPLLYLYSHLIQAYPLSRHCSHQLPNPQWVCHPSRNSLRQSNARLRRLKETPP